MLLFKLATAMMCAWVAWVVLALIGSAHGWWSWGVALIGSAHGWWSWGVALIGSAHGWWSWGVANAAILRAGVLTPLVSLSLYGALMESRSEAAERASEQADTAIKQSAAPLRKINKTIFKIRLT